MSEPAAVRFEANDSEIPPLLRTPIRSAFGDAVGASSENLLESACTSLRRSLELGPARAAAAWLLAADTFMTWACEAAVDHDGALDQLAALAFQRLTVLLAESGE